MFQVVQLVEYTKTLFLQIYLYRDNGVKAIENLMKKKGRFDYILLETTGLADPGINIFFFNCKLYLLWQHIIFTITGPIASLFWLDSELCSDIHLDGNYKHISTSHNKLVSTRSSCTPASSVMSCLTNCNWVWFIQTAFLDSVSKAVLNTVQKMKNVSMISWIFLKF